MAEKPEVETVYVARRGGEIYGVWLNKPKYFRGEELPVDHPDVVAFRARPLVERTREQKLADAGFTPEEIAKLKQLLKD